MTRHVLICLLHILQAKHLFVNNGLDASRINRSIHLLKHESISHMYASYNTAMTQAVQEGRLLLRRRPAHKSNDTNTAVGFDRFQGLRHGFGPPDFNDMIHA